MSLRNMVQAARAKRAACRPRPILLAESVLGPCRSTTYTIPLPHISVECAHTLRAEDHPESLELLG